MLSEFVAAVPGVLRTWMRHSAVRFLVVGGLSFVVDTGGLIVLHGGLGIFLPVATALANAIAFVVNFGLNKIWSFGAPGATVRQLRRYSYLSATNIVLMTLFVPLIAWAGINYIVAKVITTLGLSVMNYFISRRWIFVRSETQTTDSSVAARLR